MLAGWIGVVITIDAMAMRPWSSAAARAPLPLGLAVLVASWVLGAGAFYFSHLMAGGAWTGATITIAFVPVKAIVLSLAAYAAGRTFLSARGSGVPQRWALPALLAIVVGYSIVSDVLSLHASARERHASNPALTSEEVLALAQRVTDGAAGRGETYAFLSNPLCPPALMDKYAAATDAFFRTAVASNGKIEALLAEKLATDEDETVRIYLAGNRSLLPPVLTRLAADPSERVRELLAWTGALPDDAFNRLVEDPSPRVRATAALQPRISPEQLEKLRNDPEQRVRDAATRWGTRAE